jgi:hypothetical protein
MARYFRKSTGGTTTYGALSQKINDDGLLPDAYIEVKKGKLYPNFSVQENEDGTGTYIESREYWRNHGKKGDWSEPTELFTNQSPEISIAFAHPDLRHSVPKMAFMAAQENPGLITASDLSRHSSKLSKRGVALGLVGANPKNPTSEKTNDYDFGEGRATDPDELLPDEDGNYDYDYNQHLFNHKNELSDLENTTVDRSLRDFLRSSRSKPKAHMSEQFAQYQEPSTKLPGMENL